MYYYEIKVADFLHFPSTIYLRSPKRLNLPQVCKMLELDDKNAYPLSALKILSHFQFIVKTFSRKTCRLNAPYEWDNYNKSVITL